MKYLAGFTAVLAGFTATVSAKYIRCGAPDPPEEIMQTIDVDRAFLSKIDAGVQAISVPVYAHVVTTSAASGRYTQSQVNAQIAVMNDRYSQAGISFSLKGTDFTVNKQWAAAGQGTSTELNMKTALHKGDYGTLNLYFLSDLGGGLLGFCYFPQSGVTSTVLARDGCVILADSLPGGSATNYDQGLTAVHEVGHWFGAYHVFQGNSCSGQGDLVSDTPIQSTATEGCPVGKDSCPNQSGVDSIRNYMDYSYDDCMNAFSSGQISRMNSLFQQYRT